MLNVCEASFLLALCMHSDLLSESLHLLVVLSMSLLTLSTAMMASESAYDDD